MSGFSLDSRLAAETALVAELELCQLLLLKDRNYPWLILVPRRAGISEIFQLSTEQQQLLWHEVTAVAKALQQFSGADKINVATLGNQVAQLHVHVIARYKSDLAWPDPVWGKHPRQDYNEQQLTELLIKLKTLMAK